MRSKQLTSFSTSCRIATAVFFLRTQSVFQRFGAANHLIGFNQRTTEFLKSAKTGDLEFDFAPRCRIRETFRNGLALHFVSGPKVRTMAGIVRFMLVAIRIAASGLW